MGVAEIVILPVGVPVPALVKTASKLNPVPGRAVDGTPESESESAAGGVPEAAGWR